MDERQAGQINYRNFALPLCLLSIVFFMLYILVVPWVLIMTLHRPLDFGSVSLLIGGLVLLISCAGMILFVREMKAQSIPWTAGIPFLALFSVIIIFTVFFLSQFLRFSPNQVFLGIIALGGFMSLPCGVAYLMRSFQGIEFKAIQSFSTKTGLFGSGISVILFFSVLLMSWNSGIGTLLAWAGIFGIFHIAVLMPILGIMLFRLGLSFSKIPSAASGTGGAAEPVPRKKISESVRDLRKSISPQTKRAALIVIALVIVIAAWYVYADITDTTPCRKWTQVTSDTGFGGTSGFSSEFKGKLWLIRGKGEGITDGDAWYTSDGITWARVVSGEMVPRRVGATSAVFRDAIWIIGGTDQKTSIPGDDIWFSGTGIAWTEMQPKNAFQARSWHSTVVFHDRMWVIGGRDSTSNLNDVWYSDDGVTWVEATPSAEFSARSDHVSFVYQDKIWVVGGHDSNGNRNDVWYSGDGAHWISATASAPFSTTVPINAVVFSGRMWILQAPDAASMQRSWGTSMSQGIWYSYDGMTWTKVDRSPEFFRQEYDGEQPLTVVFQDRLYVLRSHGRDTGVWYTGE